MTEENGGRVTNRQLDDKLALIRQEQKTEHVKTRALVVILAAPNIVKALPYVLGALGLDWWHPW